MWRRLRWLIWAAILGSVALGGIVGLIATEQSPQALAQSQDSAAEVRQLAERFLGGPAFFPGSSAPVTAELLSGRVPPDLDLDVPIPSGGRLVGSVARRTGDRLVNGLVLVDANGTPDALAGFYRDELPTRGWTARPDVSMGSRGGFQSGSPFGGSEFGLYCGGEDGPYLTLTTGPRPGGGSEARLSIQFPQPAFFGGAGFGPCGVRPPQGTVDPTGAGRLPRLSAPPGVQLIASGGSFSPNVGASDAVASTNLSAAELASFFASQLSDVGWAPVGDGAEGPFAWSVWDIPGDRPGRGALTALESSEQGQVVLSLRMYSSGSPFGPIVVPTQNVVAPR
jgi:hypothetical protein